VRYGERAVTLWRAWEDRERAAWSLHDLAAAALMGGDAGDASSAGVWLREALQDWRHVADPYGAARALELMAAVAVGMGAYPRALQIAASIEPLRTASREPLSPEERARIEGTLRPAREALDEEAQRAAHAHGSAATLEEAIAFALLPDDPCLALPAQPALPSGRTPAPLQTPAGHESLRLSGREQEVLRLVAAGYSNRDVAAAPVLSERTVAHRR
jgi:hypothetical protein